MPGMTVHEFITKWRRATLGEKQAAQEHFLDLCELLGHPKPADVDPHGESFCFERGASKTKGGDGWADVWKKGYFGWEYKGKHKDLTAAYGQLNDYRAALGNPPLLVVCDLDSIVIHTNFTNTQECIYSLSYEDLTTTEGMRTLRAVFFDPSRLRPAPPRQVITEKAAQKIGDLARTLRDRGVGAHSAARFLDRLVFCMFAEDVGLLPKDVFTRAVRAARQVPERLTTVLTQLFQTMADGGFFGAEEIRHFNGDLFADAEVVPLQPNEIAMLDVVAALDWDQVEPAVFGTLFERSLDPDKRSQIGAHYTSREDIETLVEPVVMQPLRREWEEVRTTILNLLTTGRKQPKPGDRLAKPGQRDKARLEADMVVRNYLDRLASVTVLDPACGSGNFLYVTLQKLLDLEREVLSFAEVHGIGGHFPRVDPRQLRGIEINPYAFELAQLTAWIGYLQWMSQQGAPWPADPVLKRLDTFHCMDAILDLSDLANPKEPEWPAADFIVGNPPFLGGKLLRRSLGDKYVDQMFRLWSDRVPREADLCCYWFEKARRQIEDGKCRRAGLLATQGIRGGANRRVLKRIKQTGDIFFAVSDREWFLDGANVHVSMVGFDGGNELSRALDGGTVSRINPNLTSGADITCAVPLPSNTGIAFMGDTKGGAFDITETAALAMLHEPNPHGRPNSDVLVPWVNGLDLTSRTREMWIIDFGTDMAESVASCYELPFAHVRDRVKPDRDRNAREIYRKLWWRHVEARPGMRVALASLPRFLATVAVSKHRLFAWMRVPTLPDHQVFAFAMESGSAFGALHSRVHEVWARAQGTQLRERESGFRYTPTTCFETFPFPWPRGHEPTDDPRVQTIADAARELDTLRQGWLNPPEWTREEVLEFPGSADGPWARFIHEPDANGIGTVRYRRLVPRDVECAAKLKPRTLTNLYNQRPTWLALAHEKLDAAVFAAYGWDPGMSDEQLLEALLALNLERSAAE